MSLEKPSEPNRPGRLQSFNVDIVFDQSFSNASPDDAGDARVSVNGLLRSSQCSPITGSSGFGRGEVLPFSVAFFSSGHHATDTAGPV